MKVAIILIVVLVVILASMMADAYLILKSKEYKTSTTCSGTPTYTLSYANCKVPSKDGNSTGTCGSSGYCYYKIIECNATVGKYREYKTSSCLTSGLYAAKGPKADGDQYSNEGGNNLGTCVASSDGVSSSMTLCESSSAGSITTSIIVVVLAVAGLVTSL